MKVMTPIAWSYIRDGAVPPKDLNKCVCECLRSQGRCKECRKYSSCKKVR